MDDSAGPAARRVSTGPWSGRFLPVWPALFLLTASAAATEPPAGPAGPLRVGLSAVAIPFVENDGSHDSTIAFSAAGPCATTFVTRRGEIVYFSKGAPACEGSIEGWSLTEAPVRPIQRTLTPAGEEPSETRVSYFLGDDPANWRTGLRTYARVGIGELWPGVRLSLRSRGRSVEKLFTLAPGANESEIWMRVSGSRSMRIGKDGALEITTGSDRVRLTPPIAYQEKDGARRAVSARYRLAGSDYGFRLGRHDPELPVVIDPMLQSSYLGGTESDSAHALAVHPSTGEVYVAGTASSPGIPKTSGGAQPLYGGGATEVIVARFDASLTTLIQATYLGANGDDSGLALAIHPVTGDVYVAGLTNSFTFPKTAGGAQAAMSGSQDGFVARLNANLTTLIQTTYIGGSGIDSVTGMAVHPIFGDVYVVGTTSSANFPKTDGSSQPASGGGASDVFVARLDTGLTTIVRATYAGGTGADAGSGIAIDPATGQIYVTGYTDSKDFPGTAGGSQPTFPPSGPNYTAFVLSLTPGLTSIVQATYLGGTGAEMGTALAIHPASREIYVTGNSSSRDFPKTAGGAQPTMGRGFPVAFVARLNPALTSLIQATYLSGDVGTFGNAVTISPISGEIYAAGETQSLDFPRAEGGAQLTPGIDPDGKTVIDGFVARLNASLTGLFQSTYLGGNSSDRAFAVAVHPVSGDVYAAGFTSSSNFPKTAGGGQATFGGGEGGRGDAFVTRVTANLGATACTADATTLCLNGGRFQVRAAWTTRSGANGPGQAVRLTGDTGYFWFFSANNVETFVKVVNGCGLNSHVWAFGAGLTDVNVELTVKDMVSGATRTYVNPQGTAFQPIQDTSAFTACSTAGGAESTSGPVMEDRIRSVRPHGEEAACTVDATTLCLNNGRFRVQTSFLTRDGSAGSGQAVALTGDTGYFWFFSPNNVEIITKVVTGCPLNGNYWTFSGGLTDVNVLMTVIDTQTLVAKNYINPQGTPFQPIQDTASFPTCP